MRCFTTIAIAVAVTATCACTESVERIRPIPIGASPTATARQAPVVRSVAIDRVAPGPGDALACIALGSDPGGDPVQFDYQWHVDGAPVDGDDVLVGPFHSGQSVTCTATPHAGQRIGAAVSSTPFTVRSLQPVAARLAIEPPVADAETTLTCGVHADPDAPGVTLTVAWFANGARIAGARGVTLPARATEPGDAIRCQVELTEGGHTLVMGSEVRRIGGGLGDQIASVTSLPSAP